MTTGDIDPAVLASLPPSMQLDLLVQVKGVTYKCFLRLPYATKHQGRYLISLFVFALDEGESDGWKQAEVPENKKGNRHTSVGISAA